MQRKYTRTFLGFAVDDVDDFVTIRRRFDNAIDLNSTRETEMKIQGEKKIEQVKSYDEHIDQSEEIISFPYRSLLNLRHWRKAPKSLKPFIQALTCLFSISTHDFLTELKINHQLIHNLKTYRPSSIVLDEFRMKYSNLIEISPEFIRTKSFDAYLISIWMHQIDENEQKFNCDRTRKKNKTFEKYS